MTAVLGELMAKKLSVSDDWAGEDALQRLAKEYNVGQHFPEFPALQGVLLSPRGVVPLSADDPPEDGESAMGINLCALCDKSMLNRRRIFPPKYAIRNGLAVARGIFRKERMPVVTEARMTALLDVASFFATVRGGEARSLRAHVMSFGDVKPTAPADSLPRTLDAATVHIIFAEPFTKEQRVLARQMFGADPVYMRRILDAYRLDNHLFAPHHGVGTNEELLAALEREEPDLVNNGPPVPENICTILAAGVAAAAVRALDENIDSVRDPLLYAGDAGDAGTKEVEATWQIQRTGVMDTGGGQLQGHAVLTRFAKKVQPEQREVGDPMDGVTFVSRRSANLVRAKDPWRNEMAFPHLFPYGRGGPSDPDRVVHIGREALYRYHMQLSTRQFSQDPRYLLAAFDEIGMQKVISNIFVHFKVRPDDAAVVGTMTAEQLTAAIRLHVEEADSVRLGRQPAQVPADIVGGRQFVRGITAGTCRMWNSNEETKQYRKEIFALRQRFGQAHLFITFSRANKDMATVSVYAGGEKHSVEEAQRRAVQQGATEDELLRDGLLSADNCVWSKKALEHIIPSVDLESASILKKLVGNDPAAAARYFDRLVLLFIKHVLGWDVDVQRSYKGGGLFGFTRAFYGATETQGQVSVL